MKQHEETIAISIAAIVAILLALWIVDSKAYDKDLDNDVRQHLKGGE